MPSDGRASHSPGAGEPASLPFLCDEKAWTLGENHPVDYLTETSSRVQKVAGLQPSWMGVAKVQPVLIAESCQPVQEGGKLGEQRGRGAETCD